MGLTKDMLMEMEFQRQQRQEALLDAPDLIRAGNTLIQHLQEELAESRETIDDLRANVKSSQSLRSKAFDYLVGGVVGAVIGLLF